MIRMPSLPALPAPRALPATALPATALPATARRPAAFLRAAAVGLVLAGTVAACGSGGSGASSTAAPTVVLQQPGSGGTQRTPGVNGLIAAVTGSTMQVQSATKQTAVMWTGTTRFTQTGAGTLADVTVGSCVTVRSASDQSGATAAAGEPVTAASVQVFPATGGACVGGGLAGGPGGFGGARPDGATGAPNGDPGAGGQPTGAPGTAGAGDRGRIPVFGLVTVVGSGSFTVASISTAGLGAGSTAAPSTSLPTTPVTVTTTAQTTVTTTREAAATDVKVGRCATAQGPTSETGAMTATSIVLRDAVQGACTTGQGGFGRPGATATNG